MNASLAYKLSKNIKMDGCIERLYESDNFLIVNKPCDMYINSDDENEKNTVTYHVASPDSHLSISANPIHFVQRLDYSTSGVLCIAKTKRAAAKACKLFESRITRKYYLGIVRGHVEFDLADVEFEVGIDPVTTESSHKMVARMNSCMPCDRPRAAHTRMLALETGYYESDPITVLLMKPITGRRHQLRVHCNAIKHTILGDFTYSSPTDVTPHRMFLHATRLVLPISGEPLDVQSEEPFFADQKFTKKWKPEKCYYKYRSKQDFIDTCDIIDKPYVIGVKYKMFKSSD